MSRIHAWAVRHITYPLYEARRGGVVLPVLDQLEQTQWLDSATLRTLQWSRLRALLAHAFAHVPFYRDRYAAAGITQADIRSFDDVRALPVLDKADVRDGASRLRALNAPSLLVDRKTSGSTGIPIVIWVASETTDRWGAAALRARRWWNVELGDRRITLISRQPMTRKRWLKQFWFANMIEYSAMDLSEEALVQVCRWLRDPAVHALIGYPSSLAYLARFLEAIDRHHPAALRAVFTTGEILHPDQRGLLSRVFRCPVANEYGSAETGYVAAECPDGRMHIAAENVLVEVENGPGGTGGDGEILLTDLTNFAMPMIRYRIGDRGALGAPCPCGRGLPVLELSVGRIEDLVVLPDGRRTDAGIFDVVVDELTRRGIEFLQFRVIQHSLDHFEVLVVGAAGLADVSTAVAQRLIKALGTPVRVVVRSVPEIPPERTGKRRRFISHVARLAARVGAPSRR